MSRIMLNVLESALLRPEDDTQELWQMTGRIEALVSWLKARRKTALSTVYADDVAAILGYSMEGEKNEQ